jgi:SAM-dependent methyltransferase
VSDTTAVERAYLPALGELERLAGRIPNTRMGGIGKVTALVALNMRWERAMFDRELAEHPWDVAARYVRDASAQLGAWEETLFIQGSTDLVGAAPPPMEDSHQDLFQTLWVNFSADDYRDRVSRYVHRLEVNDLADGFLDGRRCIDFGCGHGNFAHALLDKGAAHVLGIDYGEESIRYAEAARERLGVPAERLAFRVESVYEVDEPDGSFGFAIQNGVFHHLDDEYRAYREMHRVLEPGGWIWVYTDGAGGVSYDLWDASVRTLSELSPEFVLEVLDFLGVETNKRYHLGDGLNATYRHTTWDEITNRLGRMGFGNFRRLVGGFPTDFDHDVIEADPWGREKFGEGDLRLLAQKVA